MNKEELVEILKNKYFQIKEWSEIADEILALDKKEEFPKYGKFTNYFKDINITTIYKFTNLTFKGNYVFKTDSGVEGCTHPSNINFLTEEEFDKQQLQEQIANLKHGEWYNMKTNMYNYLIKFSNIKNGSLWCINTVCEKTIFNCNLRELCNILNIQSITPATKEEVEKYFPDEFKPKTLLVTEDRVELYLNSEVFIVTDRLNLINVIITDTFKQPKEFKYFSTKEAAENWINLRKPYLSNYDVLQELNNCTDIQQVRKIFTNKIAN